MLVLTDRSTESQRENTASLRLIHTAPARSPPANAMYPVIFLIWAFVRIVPTPALFKCTNNCPKRLDLDGRK
jgi:hypothetical protein